MKHYFIACLAAAMALAAVAYAADPTGSNTPNGPKVTVGAFSSLPTCGSTLEGMLWGVNDSNTVVFNATIAGGSTNHVLGYCNGTNWVVGG